MSVPGAAAYIYPCRGPGKAPVVSEKAALQLLNLVPLRLFAERKRASKGYIHAAAPGMFIPRMLF